MATSASPRDDLGMRCVTVLLCALVLSAQDAAPSGDIRALMSSGDYRGALNQLNKQLFPTPTNPQEKYDLLMLKGECQLQLKDRLGAGTSFKSAAKSAEDVNKIAAARANALIVDRSTSGKFSRGIGGESIDILNVDSRKRAMSALQEQLWSQVNPRIDAALKGDKLPPIEEAFKTVADIYCLELHTGGGPAEAEKVMKQLGAHAFELMSSEVKRISSRVDYLTQLANSAMDYRDDWDARRRGLTSPERDDVKKALPYLNEIRQHAAEYRKIAALLGGNEQKWDGLVADTTDVLYDAESLFNDR